jgi:hypothetical protein
MRRVIGSIDVISRLLLVSLVEAEADKVHIHGPRLAAGGSWRLRVTAGVWGGRELSEGCSQRGTLEVQVKEVVVAMMVQAARTRRLEAARAPRGGSSDNLNTPCGSQQEILLISTTELLYPTLQS